MIILYVLLAIAAALVIALAAALIRTALMGQKVSDYTAPPADDRAMVYAKKLSKMVQCETVSHSGVHDREKFLKFHGVLEELFPQVHANLEKTELEGNLLFKWTGKASDKPIVLMSHQDVVPAEGVWEHEPFSGDIAEGKIWGRGTADTKGSLMCFFQAVEELLAEGYMPDQDVYLASSCTEEWAGDGAPTIVAELKRRGVRPFLVCDEGGAIISEPIGGIHGNFAMIGVFEKGKADVKFTATSTGGHASAPGRKTPIVRLSSLVHECEYKPPFKVQFPPQVAAMFAKLGGYAPFGLRLVMANLWLFGPIMKKVMPLISAQAAAMLRTTVAFTMQSGSHACNVLPQEATVCANMRFIPHQGEKESLAIMEALAKKHGVTMEVIHSSDYTESVDIQGEAYKRVEQVVEETFPGLAHSPYVMTGATDSSFFQAICDSCIRFAPLVFGPEQMKGMHGTNETVEVNCLPGGVDFYKNLIRAK